MDRNGCEAYKTQAKSRKQSSRYLNGAENREAERTHAKLRSLLPEELNDTEIWNFQTKARNNKFRKAQGK